jgi:hypothetical protein
VSRGGTLAVARCGVVFSCIRRIRALVIRILYSLQCAFSPIMCATFPNECIFSNYFPLTFTPKGSSSLGT